MKARAVVRDVARVMDIPYADADRVAKAIPPALDMTLAKALDENPALKEMEQKDERVKELLAVARRLEGMTRHASVHAAGVVIAPQAADRVRAALQEPEGRNRHAVGDEGGRTRRPPEDGLPRAQHADADPRRARRDQADRRHRPRHRRDPARRREDVPAVLRRTDLRRVPVRELRHARAAAQGQAGAARRPDRAQRAVSSRPAEERDGGRLHLAQAGQDRGQVRAGAARADPGRHLRRHRLPGTGHAHRRGAGRVHDGPVRRAAKGHGEEGPQGHGEAARSVHDRREGERRQREEGHEDLRPDGVLRRVRLQQVALDDLRVGGLPDRVPEGQLPGAFHGGAADDRSGEHRQAGDVPRRVPRPGRRRSCRRTSIRATCGSRS